MKKKFSLCSLKSKEMSFCRMQNSLVFFFLIVFSVIFSLAYWQNKIGKNETPPESYRILQNLESKGLYDQSEKVFRSIDGQKWILSSLKGKVVILSFWATWCEPCVDEFPSFIKLLDMFPDKLVLLALSGDEEKEEVINFIKAFKGFRKNLIVVMDENKQWNQTFGVDRLPETFIFDAQGRLLKKIIGIQNWSSPVALKFFENL